MSDENSLLPAVARFALVKGLNAFSENESVDAPQSEFVGSRAHEVVAVKAGWICLVLGFLTFWIFGFGFVFFAATFVLAIVAMSTNRVGQGVTLLVSSIASILICAVASIAFLAGAVGSALQKERAKVAQRHHIIGGEPTPKDSPEWEQLLGPKKRSVRININAATSKELQSLPGIGSSKADAIITHRPYESVDDLANVPGITSRMLNNMRSLVKIDGTTEKTESSE